MKIYVSGKITGNPDYEKTFEAAKENLKHNGFIVLTPLLIKASLNYEDFMTIDFAMISVCDAIYMLKGWEESPGAKREFAYAKAMNKKIIYEGSEPWN